jgi:hypothetical protein
LNKISYYLTQSLLENAPLILWNYWVLVLNDLRNRKTFGHKGTTLVNQSFKILTHNHIFYENSVYDDRLSS